MPAIVDFPTVVQEALVSFGELFDTEASIMGSATGSQSACRKMSDSPRAKVETSGRPRHP
jgi:hypothetical protein